MSGVLHMESPYVSVISHILDNFYSNNNNNNNNSNNNND